MWRFAPVMLVLALILGVVASPDRVKGQVAQSGAGCSVGLPPCGGVAGFQGLGDVVSGAVGFWGTQAYSAATRGNRALNVCINSGGSFINCVDWSTDATTGKVVPTNVGGSACNIVTCVAKIIYDQSGNNGCSSAACDLTATSGISAPTVTLSALGGTACLTYLGSSSQSNFTSTGFTQAQPYTISAVSERNGATSTIGIIFADGNGDVFTYYSATPNTVIMQSNINQSASATDNAFHAIQFNFQGASGNFYIDGANTNVAGSTGTTSMTAGFSIGTGGGFFLTGVVCEIALYPANENANQSTMNTNQHGSGRWNF